MNKVYIGSIDYNSTQEIVDNQIINLNQAAIGKTIIDWQLDEEKILAVYTANSPSSGNQVQFGCIINATKQQFQDAIESQDFIEFVYIGRAVIWTYRI